MDNFIMTALSQVFILCRLIENEPQQLLFGATASQSIASNNRWPDGSVAMFAIKKTIRIR